MAENTVIEKKKKKVASSSSGEQSLFSKMEKVLSFENLFDSSKISKYFFRFIWIILLGIVYIFNTHLSERMTREADALKKKAEDLRTYYMTLHSDVMFESKESEVYKKVKGMGLEDDHAPMKIKVLVEQK